MLLKVISTKTVFGGKDKILEIVMKDKAKEQKLYRVFGVIDGKQIGKGTHKRVNKETGLAEDTFWTKFFGEFIAVDLEGEVFEASTCFLPDYVSGKFRDALEGDTAIEFAFDIYARYSSDSITSYEFIALPVKREGEESKAHQMAAAFLPANAKNKQLEPPKKK